MVNKIEDSYPDGTCAADYADSLPKEVRRLIREKKITGETSGMCSEYAQANLVVLPKELAFDFLLFATKNPKACPILEVTNAGDRYLRSPIMRILQRISRSTVFTKTENSQAGIWMYRHFGEKILSVF